MLFDLGPDGHGFFEPIHPCIVPSFAPAESPLDGIVNGIAGPPGFLALSTPPGYVKWGWGHLDKSTDPSDIWHLKFYVPVFDGWFNSSTDPYPDYPYVLHYSDNVSEREYEIVSENFTASDGEVIWGDVPHADLGSNLKIQVYAYSYDIPR